MKVSEPSPEERERRLREAKIVASEPTHPLLVCLTPRVYADKKGNIEVECEEDAVVWLWAEPTLLGWRRRLEWLWSPVVGNKGWNLGDLWGIDEAGELLLLENKRLSGRRSADPFQKFDGYEESAGQYCNAEALLQRWKRMYELELLRPNWRQTKKYRSGILPNSRQRKCLERWPDLAERIDRRIRDDGYRQTVNTFLEQRRAAKSPPPHYCGLFVSVSNNPRRLLSRFFGSMARLEEAAPKRVHLFVARAEAASGQQSRVIVSQHYRT